MMPLIQQLIKKADPPLGQQAGGRPRPGQAARHHRGQAQEIEAAGARRRSIRGQGDAEQRRQHHGCLCANPSTRRRSPVGVSSRQATIPHRCSVRAGTRSGRQACILDGNAVCAVRKHAVPSGTFHRFRQPLDRRLQRPIAVAIVRPGGAFRKQRGHGAEREPLRIEIGLDLRPGQRHRYRGARAVPAATAVPPRSPCGRCADSRGRCGRCAVLGHLDQVALGVLAGHLLADVVREGLGLRPGRRLAACTAASGVTTCSPLPPVVLQKLTRPSSSRRSRISRAASTTVAKGTSGTRIEIEDQAAGHLRLLRRAVPGMQLERADLGDGRQTLDPVDLQVGLLVAEDR